MTEPHTLDAPNGADIACSSCKACCCRLEVMMMSEDDVPLQLTELDRWGGRVMARLEDGWCAALDRATMLCGIYARRPIICREYEVGGSDCIAERLNLDKIEPGQAKFAARLTQALPPSPLSARKRASGK